MKENLPMIKEKSLFEKRKNFFTKITYKLLKKENVEIESNVQESKKITSNSFKDNIKETVSNDYITKTEKEDLVSSFEENPELLNNLSLSRLEKLNKYYDEVIEEKEQKIELLKKKLA